MVRFPANQRGVRPGNALPPVVAVHRPVATDDRSNAPDALSFDLIFKFRHEPEPRPRAGIPSIGDCMYQQMVRRNTLSLCQFDEREGVIEVRVHLAARDESEHMHATARFPRVLKCLAQRLVLKESAIANRAGDAHDFLIDNAPGTDVLVSDFAVAHRALRQADILAAGANESSRPVTIESIRHRRPRELHRVERIVFRMRVLSPSIANDQYDRSMIHGLTVRRPSLSLTGRL